MLETFVMLFLLGLLILGIVWVASALIDNDAASMESLYGMSLNHPPTVVDACVCYNQLCIDLWFTVPVTFSCSRFMGVLSAVPLLLHLSDGRPVAA